MKFLTALILLLTSSIAFGGAGTFPKGPRIKALKNALEFKVGQTRITATDSDDPTLVAKQGDPGSMYIMSPTGLWFQKLDSGITTNWINALTGAAGNGTDNHVPRWDGTGTPTIQDSLVTIDDFGNMVIPGNLGIGGIFTTLTSVGSFIANAFMVTNKGGTQANADLNNAGLHVGMTDSITATMSYNSTYASKFEAGEFGSQEEVLTANHVQSFTSKTGSFVSGLVGNPSIFFDIDNDSGFWQGADNDLRISTGGAERLAIRDTEAVSTIPWSINGIYDTSLSNERSLFTRNGKITDLLLQNGEYATTNSAGSIIPQSLTGTINRVIVNVSDGATNFTTPQDIDSGANPTFSGLTLTGLIDDTLLTSRNGGTISSTGIFIDGLNNITNTAEITNAAPESLANFKSLKNQLVTGLVNGGNLSVGAPTSTFSISDGNGVVIDNHTDPDNPVYRYVSWSGLANLAVTNLATAPRSEVAIDISGSVIQQLSAFTPSQYRDLIVLGRLIHTNNTDVSVVVHTPKVSFNDHLNAFDMYNSVGNVNRSGNVLSANGVNLNVNKSSGETFREGSNYDNSKKSPNITIDAACTTCSFNYRYQDGVGGFTQVTGLSLIDPDQYDDGTGVLASVPNNRYTVKRFFYFGATNTLFFMYGQNLYQTIAGAEASIAGSDFNADPNLAGDATLRGWLIVKRNTTDLTNTGNAKFIEANKFGTSAAGGSTSATTTLQQAYNNSNGSIGARIDLNSVNSSLSIVDNAVPVSPAFKISNDTLSSRHFAVDSSYVFVNNELSLTGLFNHFGGLSQIGDATRTGTTHLFGNVTQTGSYNLAGQINAITLSGTHIDPSFSGSRAIVSDGNIIREAPPINIGEYLTFSGGLSVAQSMTGTDNQITLDVSSGLTNIYLPQDITPTSDVTFNSAKMLQLDLKKFTTNSELITPTGGYASIGIDNANQLRLRHDSGDQVDIIGVGPILGEVCTVYDDEADGVDGGSSIAGTQTRSLDSTDGDCATMVTLASDEIDLTPAGGYSVDCTCPRRNVGGSRCYLAEFDGGTVYTPTGVTSGNDTDFVGAGGFTLAQGALPASSSIIKYVLRHYTAGAQVSFGLGTSVFGDAGNRERYSQCRFIKLD